MLTGYSGMVGYMLVWSVVFLLAIPVCNTHSLSTCCLGTSGTPKCRVSRLLATSIDSVGYALGAHCGYFVEIVVNTLHLHVIDNQGAPEARRGRE